MKRKLALIDIQITREAEQWIIGFEDNYAGDQVLMRLTKSEAKFLQEVSEYVGTFDVDGDVANYLEEKPK